MPNAPGQTAVLFTAFEPSGDDHAAAVIAELRRRRPSLRVYAWGGRRMAAAGAEVVEFTGQDAVVGLPGLAKIREHQKINERIAAWLDAHPVAVHVPVDSPAANFPVAALAKERGIRVVHLVAPQIWAWGGHRIHKLRRLTDLVLCLLPFEEGWFTTRGVPARFIGHPLFDADGAPQAPGETPPPPAFPEGSPKIALMPGSRPAEMEKNFPILLEAFRRLRADRPGLVAVAAVTGAEAEERVRRLAAQRGGWPDGLGLVAGDADAVIRWCDLALVVSGTVTLQIARQRKPMVTFYKSNPILYYLVAWWLLSTRYFALPNLIAGREVVPELIPHFGGAGPIVAQASRLLDSPELMDQQRTDLARIADRFKGCHAAAAAADAIAEMAGATEPAA